MNRVELTARSVIVTRNIENTPAVRCKVWLHVTQSSLNRVFALVTQKAERSEKSPRGNTKWYLPSKKPKGK